MALKTYKYNDKTKLSEHFNVQNFKCKCGKNHDILIDDRLPQLIENVMVEIGATVAIIYSAYRCINHDKAVGGSGSSNRSHGGWAVDVRFKDKNGKLIPSSKVAIALEDMGHKYGIGYRCGKSADSSGNIHIDVKNRKWYGDESKNFSQSISSFKAPSDGKTGHKHYLDYIYKPTTKYVNASILNVRNEPNTNAKVVDGIKYGSSINVYYIENEWAKIGVSKWVSTKYIQDTKPAEKSAVSAVKEENAQQNENTVQNELPKVEKSPINDKNNEVANGKDINVGTKEETDANVGDYDYEDLKDSNNPLFYLIDLLIDFIKKLLGKK